MVSFFPIPYQVSPGTPLRTGVLIIFLSGLMISEMASESLAAAGAASAHQDNSTAHEDSLNAPDEEPSGLLSVYSDGHTEVKRIDSVPHLDWSDGNPDVRLTAPVRSVTWNATILLRETSAYRFSANLSGDITIRIAGKEVLKAHSEKSVFSAGDPVELESGEHPIAIAYRRPGGAEKALLQIFWSSHSFVMEPLPADVFSPISETTSTESNAFSGILVPQLQRLRHGEQLADAFRCSACHQLPNGLQPLKAPSLRNAAAGNSPEVLRQRLLNPSSVVRNSKMPHYGFSERQSADIAAFLGSLSSPVPVAGSSSEEPKQKIQEQKKSAEPPDSVLQTLFETGGADRRPKKTERKESLELQGHFVLRSAGCIACHTLPDLPSETAAEARRDENSHSSAGVTSDAPAGSHSEAVDTVSRDAAPRGAGSHFAEQADSVTAFGPDLSEVGKRRTAEWLRQWLQNPAALNAEHRMPHFDLPESDREALVAALSSAGKVDSQEEPAQAPGKSALDSAGTEQIESGRRLVIAARCASCHHIPGIPPLLEEDQKLVVKSAADGTPFGGCLAEENSNRRNSDEQIDGTDWSDRAPTFALSHQQRLLIFEWHQMVVNSNVNQQLALNPQHPKLSSSERGRRLVERTGCLSCHDRNTLRGLSVHASEIESSHAVFRGKSQSLIPPSLTAVGDKLETEFLRDTISGRKKSRRLPWLTVRMPQFRLPEDELNDLVSYLIHADRIPDSADSHRTELMAAFRRPDSTPATAEELLLGNQLTGAGGFNCVACHQAGAFEPRNVALGTRGSDLLTMGSRIRSRFFHRWMKNPIRVVTGIEMPAIKRAAPGILHESLPEQMAVIWRAIRDPKFTAPTVTSRYEQALTVHPGEPVRMLRDVFTVGEDKARVSVARAFAAGFSNGHNLLVDLDTMQLRHWTAGEFARQRTEGKSWFWSLGGVTLAHPSSDSSAGASKASERAAFRLRLPATSEGKTPAVMNIVADEGRFAELVSYTNTPEEIRLAWKVRFADVSFESSEASSTDHPHSNQTAWNDPKRPVLTVIIEDRYRSLVRGRQTGWQRSLSILDAPPGAIIEFRPWAVDGVAEFPAQTEYRVLPGTPAEGSPSDATGSSGKETPTGPEQHPPKVVGFRDAVELAKGQRVELSMTVSVPVNILNPVPMPDLVTTQERVTTLPGFEGTRLPLRSAIMPTAMTFLRDGRLAFTSLRGQVWIADDADQDGQEDRLTLFEEGLAAPFGILADGDSILVSHKPEILRLRDTDGDGRADHREVVASGWGFSDDYHDWTTGLIRDRHQNLIVGLGSDYSQKDRSSERDRWRGSVIQVDPSGIITPISDSFRYPIGLALDQDGRLFATDNQGVQNTFNEINHLKPGHHYGVPSRHDSRKDLQHESAAIQISHPWARSVNSILFLPDRYSSMGLSGHGIGCEYDNRFLIRWTTQVTENKTTGEIVQGAAFPFSLPDQSAGGSNFIGPICSAVGPSGDLYIGCIWDSGWQGGPNTGAITRLRPMSANATEVDNGIRNLLAASSGFRVEFFRPVDALQAGNIAAYSVRGYTRVWSGSYATPNSDEHELKIDGVSLSDDRLSAYLTVAGLKPGYVYDIALTTKLTSGRRFWPDRGHYHLKVIPESETP